jgi:PAS domain S-box-containing protein
MTEEDKSDRGSWANPRLNPSRITAAYAVVSGGWIILSDLAPLVAGKGYLPSYMLYSVAKGMAFVAITAALLHFLLVRYERQFDRSRLDHQILDERYHLLVASGNDPFFLFDASRGIDEAQLVETNEVACSLLGASFEELKGTPLSQLEALGHSGAALRRLEMGGKAAVVTSLRARDGHGVPVEVNARLFTSGNTPMVLMVARDLSDRHAFEAILSRERERLLVTLRGIAEGAVATDAGGRILLMNPAAERLTGYSQDESVAGRTLADVLRLEGEQFDLENILHLVLENGRGIAFPPGTSLVSRSGSRVQVTGRVSPVRDRDNRVIGTVLVFTEVMERLLVADDVLQGAKFESISLLAGGVAHDFNNILTSALGNVGLARTYSGANPRVVQKLDEAEQALDRARDLTNQLLAYARGAPAALKRVAPGELLSGACTLALSGAKSRCDADIAGDLWEVEGDPDQLSRALNAVILHADRAVSEGGVVSVDAFNLASEQVPSSLPSGHYVRIDISDQGPTPSHETLARIFDPYAPGNRKEGTLGLALAFSIVRRHQGTITAHARAGGGTTISLVIPAVPPPTDGGDEVLAGEGRRILVMDGEIGIRQVTAEMLEGMGFTCEMASNGQEAVELYRRAQAEGRPFFAALLDLTVAGGVGGEEAMKGIRELDPAARAIVSSGYAGNPVVIKYRQAGFSGAIVKPYTARDLGKALRRVL